MYALSIAWTSSVQAQVVEQDFDGITFIKIDSDYFVFGAEPSQQYRKGNERQRAVPLGHTFWISKYEVTQGEWMAVMGSNPSTFVSSPPDYSGPETSIKRRCWRMHCCRICCACRARHMAVVS